VKLSNAQKDYFFDAENNFTPLGFGNFLFDDKCFFTHLQKLKANVFAIIFVFETNLFGILKA